MILPGDRVKAFDASLFIDDKKTPLSVTMKPGTVVRRYGKKVHYRFSDEPWFYPDLIDIKFDHRENVSVGHFTDMIKVITGVR